MARVCTASSRYAIVSLPIKSKINSSSTDGIFEETFSIARELCTAAIPSLKDSRQPEIIATFVIIMGLALLSVLLRLISRKISITKFGWDDYLIVFALVSR